MLVRRAYDGSPSSSHLRHLAAAVTAEPHLTTFSSEPNSVTCDSTKLARRIAALLNGQPIPWPPSLSAPISTLTSDLTRPVVLRALDLIKPPSAALQFFLHVRRRRLLRLDDQIHFKMLQVLCRCRNLTPARDFLASLHTDPTDETLVLLHDRFFNELIRAHARFRQLRQAIELFEKMKSEFKVPPSVFSYNSLLSALLRRGRTQMARDLFDEMLRKKNNNTGEKTVSPDVCTFNIMIRGYCMNKMLDEAFRCFKLMQNSSCQPDLQTYNTLIDGLCRGGKNDIAFNLLNGMNNSENNHLRPNAVSYTTLIRGFCDKGLIFDALNVFKMMVKDGVKPNSITYNTLIQGLCKGGDVAEIKEMSAAASRNGFKPDICTINTLITASCNRENVEDAMSMFHMTPDLKIKPDSVTYSVLVQALCKAGDFQRAEMLLDDAMKTGALSWKRSLMAAYNPILKHLCLNGKATKAGIVFGLLLKKSTVDVATFKIMILGYCNEGKLHEGYGTLVTMLGRELVPDEETYQALIDGFLSKGDLEFAWKSFNKMLKSGHRPKTEKFHSMLGRLLGKIGFASEACELLVVMLERKIMQNIDLSTDCVIALYRDGLHGRGFEIIQLLYEKGYNIKMEKLVGILCNDSKFFEVRDLILFCVEKQQNLEGTTYAKAIQGLCQIGRASDGFRLFYELNEVGRAQSFSDCLEDLEFELQKEEKFNEAEFVHNRRKNLQTIGKRWC